MLSISEFSDREVLAVLADVEKRHGEIRSEYVQLQMNLTGPNPHAAIGCRLAWMRKFGVLDKDDETGAWIFTPFGSTMLNGQVSAQARKSVDAMKEAQVVTLMQDVISSRYRRGTQPGAAMIRRAWQYGTHANRGR